ncbi:aldo/keto reductase [Acinetobacter populi]|uniref:Aldo/keto reductase n=1 Tax=Acinetobacter populi TaxID=1582270 RepID=A0A1Z9YZ81_9GAMM|nr:aldo/keto reductase [Acinetobacter populi]OUY07519.1 aldo/keto reductase [Acinetobacter populi]
MHIRQLSNNLQVSSMGFGAMGLSEFYGEVDDNKSLEVLNKLLDLDITFIDTANIYGDGHNERLIGYFLANLNKSDRQKFTIATKCGIDRIQKGNYSRSINNHPEYITQCCNESLQRLGVERIDLFYLHRVDNNIIEESMDCLANLVKQGKIHYVGLCEVSAPTLRKAHSIFPVTALQTEYSLWTRDVEDEILPTVEELDISFIPYSPLGRGFLTGKYINNSDFSPSDFRKNNERFLQENLEHNREILNILTPIATKYEATIGQISLAWLLAKYHKIIPIPGTKNIEYLIENSKAADLRLDKHDLNILNDSKFNFNVRGHRYNSEGMKGINV